MTRRGGKKILGEKKWDKEGRGAADDGATSHSVEAFQFGKIGNA